MAGFLTSKQIWGCTTFVDHVSDCIYVHLMKDFTIIKTLLAKLAFKKLFAKADCSVKHYQADNCPFSNNEFLATCNYLNQTIEFCKFTLLGKTSLCLEMQHIVTLSYIRQGELSRTTCKDNKTKL